MGKRPHARSIPLKRGDPLEICHQIARGVDLLLITDLFALKEINVLRKVVDVTMSVNSQGTCCGLNHEMAYTVIRTEIASSKNAPLVPDRQITCVPDFSVQPSREKYSASLNTQINLIDSAVSSLTRGVSRSSWRFLPGILFCCAALVVTAVYAGTV